MKGLVIAIGFLLFTCNSAVAADKKDAFLIEKRDFKKQYRTIAIVPADADAFLEMPGSVAAILEEEVSKRLEKRGYTVIDSSVFAGIRDMMERQVGGLTDPDSGRQDAAKAQAVRAHAFREMWFTQSIDAIAAIRVLVDRVPMESDRVEWDGVKQKIQYEGRGKKYSATIAVSTVSVAVFDATNKPLYQFYGGLEPLMHRQDEQLQVLAADTFFLDEKRVRKAAQIAVGPF